MSYTSANLLVHLVFSTQDGRRQISSAFCRIYARILGGIVRELKGTALIINGTNDHAHLLVWVPPACSIAELTRTLKSNSSKWIHQKWPDRQFAWQSG